MRILRNLRIILTLLENPGLTTPLSHQKLMKITNSDNAELRLYKKFEIRHNNNIKPKTKARRHTFKLGKLDYIQVIVVEDLLGKY